MTDTKDVAGVWVATVQGRGVALVVHNNRLRLLPADAYGQLSDDERAVLRHNREAIKRLVRTGAVPTAPAPTPSEAPPEIEAPSAPLEEQCRHGCGSLVDCANLKASHPDTWLVVHGRDGEALEFRRRRDDERYENTARLWELAGVTRPDYT